MFLRFSLISLLLITVITFLCSCESGRISDSDDNYTLTEKESTDLVTVARFIILKNSKKFINDQEKIIIETQQPDVKTSYSGPKTGKMTITWSFPNRDLRIIASGELLSGSRGWRVTVVKKDPKWETNQNLVKKGKVEQKDFQDLVNDQPSSKTLPPK